jgi:phosphoenolpyruvate-protein phosphotransferase (PTS system enzyme I)
MENEIGKRFLKGISASPGIALGKACVFQDILLRVSRHTLAGDQTAQEVERFKGAVRQVVGELMKDNVQASRTIGKEEAAIFLAQAAMLEDPYYLARIIQDIRENGMNAEAAVLRQVAQFSKVFEQMDDPYFRDRGADLRDVARRVIEKLSTSQEPVFDFEQPVIIVARELTPSDTVRLDRKKILAFATESGGKESHAAILARSLGIPAVTGLDNLLLKVNGEDELVVDGDMGTVVISPPEEVKHSYRDLLKKREAYRSELEEIIPLASETLDGRSVRLWANIGGLADLEYALHFGAHGIGLYRTEMPFLVWGRFLSEEEQTGLYQKVVEQTNGRDVTIRTLDFGGDKFLGETTNPKEKNPFLGYRSIRIFLKEKDLLKQQLRAILRASAYGPVRILFPMISSIEEVRQIRELVESSKKELSARGIPFDKEIPVGAMIEVPSAAIVADQLIKEVDFLSIGTNDLVQYTLAVDRDNELVSSLYQPLNPAVLRLIQNVTDIALAARKPMAVCGEMAGDLRFIPLLVGMGITDLSMNPVAILEAKKMIRSLVYTQWEPIAKVVLDLSSAEEIKRLLSKEYDRTALQLPDALRLQKVF